MLVMLIQYVTLLHIFMNGDKGRAPVLTIESPGVTPVHQLEVVMAAANPAMGCLF